MTGKKDPSKKYQSVDPDDFHQYEEQFIEKGGGGSGGKDSSRQGSKTIRSLKIQQRRAARDQRQEGLEEALLMVLESFPDFDQETQKEEFVLGYISWVNDNLRKMTPVDPSELEVSFSKSGGPGGQNVNKRETRVALRHKPTHIRVVNEQTRSQMENRRLAETGLRVRLEDHLRDWKIYLGGQRNLDITLVKDLVDNSRRP